MFKGLCLRNTDYVDLHGLNKLTSYLTNDNAYVFLMFFLSFAIGRGMDMG